MKRSLLALSFSLTFLGCAHFQPPIRPVVGIPEFQQWCLRALRQPNAAPAFHQFSAAYHRDPQALRAYFAEARQQCESSLIDAAGGEWLNWTLETLLYRFGDQEFAAVLSRESPRTQSAVGSFVQKHSLLRNPKTQKILHDAPKIDFPLYKTYRNA